MNRPLSSRYVKKLNLRVQFFLEKYSFEMKKKIVKAYLNGEGSYTYLANKYKVPDKKPIQQRGTSYKAFGEEGLMRSRKNEIYAFEFKIHVVNDFRIAGPDAFDSNERGGVPRLRS